MLRIHHVVITLAYQAEGVLLKLLESVPRLKTNFIRNWALTTIPPIIRESLIRRVTREWEGVVDKKQVVQKVWSVLYSHQMVCIEVPPYLDEKTRHSIISYFGCGHQKQCTTPLIHLRTIAHTEELSSIENIVSYSPLLTEIQIRRGATDALLGLLGLSCPNLSEINFTCSVGVTDEGISLLLENSGKLNSCHLSLKHVKLRGTRVRCSGVRLLLQTCLSLEGIRCNTMDVMQALSMFLKEDKKRYDGSILSMKYMDFSSCFALFADRLHMMPFLQEARIGADVPPQLKSLSIKHKGDKKIPKEKMFIALRHLNSLSYLQSLVVKDFSSEEISVALDVCGKKLKTLEIHFITSGINLQPISSKANNLTHLSISDSSIFHSRGQISVKSFLPKLEVCRLMRVTYRDEAEIVVLSRCHKLQVLHQEAGPGINDQLMEHLICSGYLTNLREIVINGNCQLGSETVEKLPQLPNLFRFGDIQDWNISEEERKGLLLLLKSEWDKKMGYSRNINLEE